MTNSGIMKQTTVRMLRGC